MKNPLFLLFVFLLAAQANAGEIWGSSPWWSASINAQAQFAHPFVQANGPNPTLADTLWTAVSISDNNGANVPGNAFWTRSTLGYSQGVNSTGVPLNSPSQANGVALFDSDYLDNGGIVGNQGNGSAPAVQRGELISPLINLIGYADTALGLKLHMRYDAVILNELSVSFSKDNGATWGPAYDLTASHANNCEGWSTVLFTDNPLWYTPGVWGDSSRIKFTFEGAYNYVAIDDVSLFTGNAGWYSSWNNGSAWAPTYAVVEGVQCDGGPFTSPSGKVWNSLGTYYDTIANSYSRDSIMTFCLVAGSSNTGIDTVTACGSYTWINGNTYTASNTMATDTLTNASGCDSVVTLNLTIIPLLAEALTIADSSSVCVGASTVTIANTQTGFDYYLRNDANNSIVSGPLAGTGSAGSMNSDTIHATKTYNVIGGVTALTALEFDGMDESVVVPNDSAFEFSVGTVELWVRTDDTSSVNRTMIAMRDNPGSNTRWSFHINTQTNVIGAYTGGSFGPVGVGNIVPGEWHHVAFRTYPDSIMMFWDGSYVGSAPFGIDTASVGKNLLIGNHEGQTYDNEDFIGAIDGVRIWNVARTNAQILAAKDSCLTGNETGLVALYDFEDSGDNTLTDLTGNGHDGTLTNMDAATDWVTSGKLCWECSIEMANTVTLTINPFPGDSIVTTSSIICDTLGGTTTFDISGSVPGLTYAVFDTAFTFFTQGVPGTGGPISLTSDTITAPTLLGVYAVNVVDASSCTAIMSNGHSVSIASPTSSTDSQTACGSYTWMDGNTYTSSNNTAVFTTTNAAGCDSVITLDLTILSASSSIDTQVACGSYIWTNGVTYTASNNTATDTLQNAAGCDSVITLNLTINQPNTGIDTQAACGPYMWIDGNTYTSSNNTATHTLQNAAGCDSVVTLNLTIASVLTSTDTQVACGSYMWIDGNTYTSSNNTATDTLMSSAGCDSIVTLNLTINQPTTGTDVQTACGSYTWIDGSTYTSNNNTATHTLQNAAGCDSVVTLDLTINTVDVGVTNSDPSLTANAMGANYQWLDCNDGFAAISGATDQAYNPAANGDYAVEITQNSCVDTSTCETIVSVGLWELANMPQAQLYPNPSNGTVTLELGPEMASATVVVTNAVGQVVYRTRSTDSHNLQLDLPRIAGLYFVKLEETGQVLRAVVR